MLYFYSLSNDPTGRPNTILIITISYEVRDYLFFIYFIGTTAYEIEHIIYKILYII
jgi:hypothetical protein